MYPNLMAEIARNNKTYREVSHMLGISAGTFSKRINGEVSFSYNEATKLRSLLCPDKSWEYLMETKEK